MIAPKSRRSFPDEKSFDCPVVRNGDPVAGAVPVRLQRQRKTAGGDRCVQHDSASFNEVATLINNNSDAIDDEIISTFQEMSALLTQYKDILEGDGDITDEKYDEMIKWFSDVQTWSKDAKTDIETALTNAQA